MQTLVVYQATKAANDSETGLNAISDPSMSQQNNHYILPRQMQLYAALGLGTALSIVKLDSPSMRRVASPYIYPFVIGSAVPADPNIADYRPGCLNLPALEEIAVYTSNSGAATPVHTVGLFLQDSYQPLSSGMDVFTVKCTATITAVVNAWTSGNLTFSQTLPVGTYAIVGMMVVSATAIFGRLIFPGGTIYRPGVVACPTMGLRQPWQGKKCPVGVMGTFQSTALPQLDVFCTAADTTQTVFVDIVKVS